MWTTSKDITEDCHAEPISGIQGSSNLWTQNTISISGFRVGLSQRVFELGEREDYTPYHVLGLQQSMGDTLLARHRKLTDYFKTLPTHGTLDTGVVPTNVTLGRLAMLLARLMV